MRTIGWVRGRKRRRLFLDITNELTVREIWQRFFWLAQVEIGHIATRLLEAFLTQARAYSERFDICSASATDLSLPSSLEVRLHAQAGWGGRLKNATQNSPLHFAGPQPAIFQSTYNTLRRVSRFAGQVNRLTMPEFVCQRRIRARLNVELGASLLDHHQIVQRKHHRWVAATLPAAMVAWPAMEIFQNGRINAEVTTNELVAA
jgi:hypothetical protein